MKNYCVKRIRRVTRQMQALTRPTFKILNENQWCVGRTLQEKQVFVGWASPTMSIFYWRSAVGNLLPPGVQRNTLHPFGGVKTR